MIEVIPEEDVLASVFVLGVPVPQGWIRSLGKGRPSIYGNAAKLKPWRDQVAADLQGSYHARSQRAQMAAKPVGAYIETPPAYADAVTVSLRFYLPRPKTVKRPYPTVPPDLDKLERAVLDALKLGGVLRDDALVCDLHTTKRYATTTALRAYDGPGLEIIVVKLHPPIRRE